MATVDTEFVNGRIYGTPRAPAEEIICPHRLNDEQPNTARRRMTCAGAALSSGSYLDRLDIGVLAP